jgi:hypothetical protein
MEMSDVHDYFHEISDLLENKFLVPPSAMGHEYEIKEPGQPVFCMTPRNVAWHRCVALEKGGLIFPLFKTTHRFAHKRSDRLFVLWDEAKQRLVFLACELKSKSSRGAWTQLQVTLAFARQLDALARVNRPMAHKSVFAAITARTTPMALKRFDPASQSFDWQKPSKGCALEVHHAHVSRSDGALRLAQVMESLP